MYRSPLNDTAGPSSKGPNSSGPANFDRSARVQRTLDRSMETPTSTKRSARVKRTLERSLEGYRDFALGMRPVGPKPIPAAQKPETAMPPAMSPVLMQRSFDGKYILF